MSISERIILEIEKLPDDEKSKVLKKIKEKYFKFPKDTIVTEENYDFWLNDKDDQNDRL